MNEKEIIEKIKAQAKAKGLTRYRIAKTMEVQESQLKRWFEHTTEPSLSNLLALCHAVGLEIELKPLQNEISTTRLTNSNVKK